MDAPGSLEVLQARHRKEQRELVARITQKKKSATKKTRKGVNDECDRLEHELKERQAQELAALSGEGDADGTAGQESQNKEEEPVDEVQEAVEKLAIAPPAEANGDSAGPKKKRNRAKERLARRAAEQEAMIAQAKEEAANVPDQRELERKRMQEQFEKHGLREKEIRADGHCLYSAVADQLETAELGLKPRIQPVVKPDDGDAQLPPYKTVRHAAADFIAQTPDAFVPFMEEPLEDYLRKIRETGEWGGHMELLALAKAYGVKINVLHSDGRVDSIEPEATSEETKEIWLGYYKHNFGLGEHYNSLRKVTAT